MNVHNMLIVNDINVISNAKMANGESQEACHICYNFLVVPKKTSDSTCQNI